MNCQTKARDFTRAGQRSPEEAPIAFTRRNVEFASGGVTCRAWVYVPAADGTGHARPCIVMGHGLGGTRDASLEPYAKRFAAAGFYVLLFDYRYLGASDGKPRQLISIPGQLDDWAAAIAFARAMPGVDPMRIGLWGCSLAAGYVLTTAARDGNIAAISVQCPMFDGAASTRMCLANAGLLATLRLTAIGFVDAVRGLLGLSPRYVPLVALPGGIAAMSSEDALRGCVAIMAPGWRNELAARFCLEMPLYRPVRRAAEVRCPALIIVCEKDTVASTQAAYTAAARMGNSAHLVSLPIGHFDVYLGQWFERSSQEQVQFFKDALHV